MEMQILSLQMRATAESAEYLLNLWERFVACRQLDSNRIVLRH